MTRRKGAFTRAFFVNKLCFLPLHLPKFFFMQLLVYPFCSWSLTFPNLELVFRLVHDHVYIHDEICVYASLD